MAGITYFVALPPCGSMSNSSSSQAIFENELVRELNRFGSFATQGFRVPETNTRLARLIRQRAPERLASVV
jgi:hypothetical protein